MAKERCKGGSKSEEAARESTRRPSAGSVTKRRDAVVSLRDVSTAPKRVCIIGGVWKRTPLPVADATGLRPTPDRVRETLFNWIEHLVPDLEAVRAVDLFAGTGALGFELASRGAQRVTLIENNRQLVEHLAQTKQRLGADQIDIVAGDALSAAARWPAASFEIVFIDPPFDSSLLGAALAAAVRLLSPAGLIYAESSMPLPESLLAQHRLQLLRASRAGRVYFHLLRHQVA